MIFLYFELIQKSAAAALLLQMQHYFCRCSSTAATAILLLLLQHIFLHKAKFDSYMPNNSIFCFYKPDLTSITAAAAAAVAALF